MEKSFLIYKFYFSKENSVYADNILVDKEKIKWQELLKQKMEKDV